MNHLLTDFQAKADKVVQLYTNDLATIKTGRAKPSLVEHIKIEAYPGSYLEVRELATISAPDAHSLTISPWDKSILKQLERGLTIADPRLNPVVDKDMIRIHIPPLTEESRRDLVKLVKQKLEAHKAMVRSERTASKKMIEDQKNSGGVSEDDIHQDLETLQEFTDAAIDKLDKLSQNKDTEIMTV